MGSRSEIFTYEELEATDVINVELVPELKGLILKHCEYYVSSRRHGTTVTRRYNEFVQLYDVLFAKYPYRAVPRLPPKRVVVGGGSPVFLQRRRSALQRWLTLVARHPVLAHDADLRMFLCELTVKLDKPKHDEFMLAGTQDCSNNMTIEELQDLFVSEQEQLRLLHLGLGRLFQIFEKVDNRIESERSDIRELGAALNALSSVEGGSSVVRQALSSAARLALQSPEGAEVAEEGAVARCREALEAVGACVALAARLTRGLHAERAAASRRFGELRERHRYALRTAAEESQVARVYAISSLECLGEIFNMHSTSHNRVGTLWADLYAAIKIRQ